MERAYAGALLGATVPWVASAGWATLSSLVAIKDAAELDLPELKQLLKRVQKTIHQAPDGARYEMNGLITAAGSYVTSLTDLAIEIGETIGPVTADLGDNQCQIPFAPDYTRKVQERGAIGEKRKTAKG